MSRTHKVAAAFNERDRGSLLVHSRPDVLCTNVSGLLWSLSDAFGVLGGDEAAGIAVGQSH